MARNKTFEKKRALFNIAKRLSGAPLGIAAKAKNPYIRFARKTSYWRRTKYGKKIRKVIGEW